MINTAWSVGHTLEILDTLSIEISSFYGNCSFLGGGGGGGGGAGLGVRVKGSVGRKHWWIILLK